MHQSTNWTTFKAARGNKVAANLHAEHPSPHRVSLGVIELLLHDDEDVAKSDASEGGQATFWSGEVIFHEAQGISAIKRKSDTTV